MSVIRLIPEVVVPGMRLGRHVNHDDRSLAYLVPEADSAISVKWPRAIPVLDQGNLGSCTGNACVGALGTYPTFQSLAQVIASGNLKLNEAEAVSLYSAAEVIDGGVGYPPEDDGSSGLSVAKAAKNAKLISGYLHATSVAAAHSAIQTGPFMIGSNWYSSFDTPSASGVITLGGSIRGGHEYECLGYDANTDLWECVNSWGLSYGVEGHFFMTTPTFTELLAEEGDATALVPWTQPSPVPTPTPAPTPGPTPAPTPTPPIPVPGLPPDPTEFINAAAKWYREALVWSQQGKQSS